MTKDEWQQMMIRKVKAERRRKVFVHNLLRIKAKEKKMNAEFKAIVSV